MLKKITVFPNGNIEYNYGDVVIVEDNRGNKYTKSTYYDKGQNGYINPLPTSSHKHGTDKLYNHI